MGEPDDPQGNPAWLEIGCRSLAAKVRSALFNPIQPTSRRPIATDRQIRTLPACLMFIFCAILTKVLVVPGCSGDNPLVRFGPRRGRPRI
jgi:hypothetical protein